MWRQWSVWTDTPETNTWRKRAALPDLAGGKTQTFSTGFGAGRDQVLFSVCRYSPSNIHIMDSREICLRGWRNKDVSVRRWGGGVSNVTQSQKLNSNDEQRVKGVEEVSEGSEWSEWSRYQTSRFIQRWTEQSRLWMKSSGFISLHIYSSLIPW